MINFLRKTPTAKSLDATGVGLSVLCVAHCLLFPTAAAAAPILAPGMSEVLGASHAWHLGLLLVAAPVSLIGLGWGARVAQAGWLTVGIGLFGLVLMGFGAAHIVPPVAETALTLTGVTLLGGAHLANWRARARRGHVHVRECGMCETDRD